MAEKWIRVRDEFPRAADINGNGVPYSDEVLVVHTEPFLNQRRVSAAIMSGSSWIDRYGDELCDVELWAEMPAPPEREANNGRD